MSQERCDVLVVGAGVSGLAAAVAAGKEGAKTILVEQSSDIGGTATRGMLRQICGLYSAATSHPVSTLNSGVSHQIADALGAAWMASRPVLRGRVWILPFRAADLTSCFSEWLRAARVECFLETRVSGVQTAGKNVVKVMAQSAQGQRSFFPATVVDCTGAAAVARLCGAAEDKEGLPRRQMAGYVMRLRGLSAVASLVLQVPWALARGVAGKQLPPAARWTTLEAGDAEDEGYLKLSVPPESANASFESEAEHIVAWLREALPSFARARVAAASGVLEREGSRLLGEYELTENDVLHGRKQADSAARGAWPVERWDPERGFVLRHLEGAEYYDIPVSCLRSRGLQNLWAGGRCISATREALGSARVMGVCFATGEAAGRGAAAWAGRH